MRATRKGMLDTSEFCLLQGLASDMLTEFKSGTPGPQHGYNDAYAQNQAYQASMASGQHPQQPAYDPNAPQQQQQHRFEPQSSDPNAPNYDPNAPPMSEGERGLLGALGGGVGGHLLGKKAGHGFLGTVGGGILGSLAEDFLKDKTKKHHILITPVTAPHGVGQGIERTFWLRTAEAGILTRKRAGYNYSW
jgi:hypothetical protein